MIPADIPARSPTGRHASAHVTPQPAGLAESHTPGWAAQRLLCLPTRMDTTMIERFRNVIIGSGEAGKWLAWTLAGQGESTVVVERSKVGGACPNVACLPSKNVIYSAKVAA